MTTKDKVQTIKIVTGAKVNFRNGSARAEYYARLKAYDKKPLVDFVASVEKDPPSVPNKGKLAGKPEPVTGWISWFTRNGYAEIVTA
jgi:hypothetical protein